MKSYGQFCSMARALELLGERWTLLVVRELLMGSSTFGDIRRGIPRISRTMLSARLRELADGGAIERDGGGYAPDRGGPRARRRRRRPRHVGPALAAASRRATTISTRSCGT